MNLIVTLNYLLTICLILWVIFIQKPQYSFVPLFISGLIGIPIYYFGNSSSGGIFPADILALTIFLRFGLKYGRTWLKVATKRKVLMPFLLLTLWATFSSIYAIFKSDYGEKYLLFLVYGIGRWWTFALFVILFFGFQFQDEEFKKITKKLFYAFGFWGLLLLIHQYGVLDLSGIEGLGPRIIEATQDILDTYEIKSMFWGSNRACVGAICFTGFWVAILLWSCAKEHIWRRNALILAILMAIGLIGSWSRSDFAGIVASFISFSLIAKKRLGLKAKIIGFIVITLIFNIWIIITILDIDIESSTLARYSALFGKKWYEEGVLEYRRIMHGAIIENLFNNKEILITGTGANGFRSFYGEGVIWSNAAHNAFLHNLTELGVIGVSLIIVFFYFILKLSRISNDSEKAIIYPILVSFLLGRFIAGYAVDTFFAVDAMLPANIMLLGFIGLLISKSFIFEKQRGYY